MIEDFTNNDISNSIGLVSYTHKGTKISFDINSITGDLMNVYNQNEYDEYRQDYLNAIRDQWLTHIYKQGLSCWEFMHAESTY